MGPQSTQELPQLQPAGLVTCTPTADRPNATQICPRAASMPLLHLLRPTGSQPIAKKAAGSAVYCCGIAVEGDATMGMKLDHLKIVQTSSIYSEIVKMMHTNNCVAIVQYKLQRRAVTYAIATCGPTQQGVGSIGAVKTTSSCPHSTAAVLWSPGTLRGQASQTYHRLPSCALITPTPNTTPRSCIRPCVCNVWA